MQKILVVDDAEWNRELLHEILKDEYMVEMAENGMQAMEKLQDAREEVAALLLDLHMPGMDGYAVIEAMKKQGIFQRFPVLVISSENTAAVENQCLELGISDFIHRPFEGSIVKNRIRNTVELFAYKNQLEQKVEEQYRIIQKQAEKLQEAKPFNILMMEYNSAIMEIETRLKILNAEFSQEYNRNPFESIKSLSLIHI